MILIYLLSLFLFVTIDVFRAMAMCFALMFGRFGSVAGSSLTAILLERQCQSAFYTAGFSLIGEIFFPTLISSYR